MTIIQLLLELANSHGCSLRIIHSFILKLVKILHPDDEVGEPSVLIVLSDYDNFHPWHFRPKEGLKLREYCSQEAPLTIGTVKDPYCIYLLSGRLVGL